MVLVLNERFTVMKKHSQIAAMRSVRKFTVFVGKVQGPPKGARGYDRKREKRSWSRDDG